MKIIYIVFFKSLFILAFSGCYMADKEDADAPVSELGVLIKPNEEYAFNSEFGIVRVKYLNETSRSIELLGVQTNVELKKSRGLNGLYTDGKIIEFPEKYKLRGLIYEEGTPVSFNDRTPDDLVAYLLGVGYQKSPAHGFYYKIIVSPQKENFLYVSLVGVEG